MTPNANKHIIDITGGLSSSRSIFLLFLVFLCRSLRTISDIKIHFRGMVYWFSQTELFPYLCDSFILLSPLKEEGAM
jgi:hypothetical protein